MGSGMNDSPDCREKKNKKKKNASTSRPPAPASNLCAAIVFAQFNQNSLIVRSNSPGKDNGSTPFLLYVHVCLSA